MLSNNSNWNYDDSSEEMCDGSDNNMHDDHFHENYQENMLVDLNVFNEYHWPFQYDNSDKLPLMLDEPRDLSVHENGQFIASIKYIIHKQLISEKKQTYHAYVTILECCSDNGQIGMGDILLKELISIVSRSTDVRNMFVHVQSDNEDAIEFYRNHRFQFVKHVDKYFYEVIPRSAILMKRRLR